MIGFNKKNIFRFGIIIVIVIVVSSIGLGYWAYHSGLIFEKVDKSGLDIPLIVDKELPLPPTYHIENVPYYGEKNWCWGSSALMLLMDAGFSDKEIQNARNAIKTKGKGGPPDMFIGFGEYDLVDNVRLAYSKDYVKEYADFYNTELLISPEKQTILFNNQNDAFEYLKRLISSNVLVMIVVHNGNHFVIATGYDEDYIYTNDPGWDNGYDYKIDAALNLEQRRILLEDFLEEWSISGQEKEISGKIGFPGNYGMIWLVK